MWLVNKMIQLKNNIRHYFSSMDKKKVIIALLTIFMLTGLKIALASSTTDFDLSPVNDSVESHTQGDVGRLLLLIGFLFALYLAVVKHSYMPMLILIFSLLGIHYFPGIIDSSTGS
ncbi:MAG: hypothetical protein ACK4PR_06000 [Gammaproteobacteria bacterium]